MRTLRYSHNSHGYTNKYFLKTAKNILIYSDVRENHLENSYQVSSTGEKDYISEMKYLIVKVPNIEENKEKVNLLKGSNPNSLIHLYLQKTETPEYIELSYPLDRAFNTGFVSGLEQLGFIKKMNWLEIPDDKTKGNYYVNPTWYQIIFNLFNLLYEGIFWLGKKVISSLRYNKKDDTYK